MADQRDGVFFDAGAVSPELHVGAGSVQPGPFVAAVRMRPVGPGRKEQTYHFRSDGAKRRTEFPSTLGAIVGFEAT